MEKPIEGESAFPSDRFGMTGLSERRYYLAAALTGFCANPEFANTSAKDIAVLAEHQADAVMRLLHLDIKK